MSDPNTSDSASHLYNICIIDRRGMILELLQYHLISGEETQNFYPLAVANEALENLFFSGIPQICVMPDCDTVIKIPNFLILAIPEGLDPGNTWQCAAAFPCPQCEKLGPEILLKTMMSFLGAGPSDIEPFLKVLHKAGRA